MMARMVTSSGAEVFFRGSLGSTDDRNYEAALPKSREKVVKVKTLVFSGPRSMVTISAEIRRPKCEIKFEFLLLESSNATSIGTVFDGVQHYGLLAPLCQLRYLDLGFSVCSAVTNGKDGGGIRTRS